MTEQRPNIREHVLKHGCEDLSLPESVALILRSGTKERPLARLSLEVAHALRNGACTVPELRLIPGLGNAKAASLVAGLTLGSLLARPALSDYLLSPEAVFRSCADLVQETQEHLVCFFLDVRRNTVRREVVSLGTATASLVHPREVFRQAIVHNAHSIIIAHNHPSGDPAPSGADYQVTRQLALAGSQLGIELLDHVVCARGGFVSLRETNPELFP